MHSRTVVRFRDACDRARNEQQKLVLLCAVVDDAKTRFGIAERAFEQLIVDVLHTELHVGLTFATIAMNSDNGSQQQSRNVVNARKAYRTAVDWSKRSLPHTTTISEELNTKLGELKDALVHLGEQVGD